MAIQTMTEADRIALNNSTNKRQPGSNMDKDDFLKLLCVQMQNQDPMSPMEDMQFISEMAQFSSLEQMLNINNAIEDMASSMKLNQTNQALMLLGTTVTSTESEEDGSVVSGTVEMIGFKDGEPYLKVGNTALTLDQIKLIGYK